MYETYLRWSELIDKLVIPPHQDFITSGRESELASSNSLQIKPEQERRKTIDQDSNTARLQDSNTAIL